MSTDKIREEFEEWAMADAASIGVSIFPRREGEWYGDNDLNTAWAAWKASRASLLIDLPQGGYFAGYDNEHMMESRDVKEALETAGVKFK